MDDDFTARLVSDAERTMPPRRRAVVWFGLFAASCAVCALLWWLL